MYLCTYVPIYVCTYARMYIRYVEQFLRHLKTLISINLMGLLAGTMIFELALKNDTESTYFIDFEHH